MENEIRKDIPGYESMREAERQTNIAHSSIKKAITGKLKNAGGFQWEYKKLLSLCRNKYFYP